MQNMLNNNGKQFCRSKASIVTFMFMSMSMFKCVAFMSYLTYFSAFLLVIKIALKIVWKFSPVRLKRQPGRSIKQLGHTTEAYLTISVSQDERVLGSSSGHPREGWLGLGYCRAPPVLLMFL